MLRLYQVVYIAHTMYHVGTSIHVHVAICVNYMYMYMYIHTHMQTLEANTQQLNQQPRHLLHAGLKST